MWEQEIRTLKVIEDLDQHYDNNVIVFDEIDCLVNAATLTLNKTFCCRDKNFIN